MRTSGWKGRFSYGPMSVSAGNDRKTACERDAHVAGSRVESLLPVIFRPTNGAVTGARQRGLRKLRSADCRRERGG